MHWLDPSGTTLTYDGTVETGDSRFKIDHSYLKEWNLEIDNVRRTDAGNYTCGIGPTPAVQNVVELVVVGKSILDQYFPVLDFGNFMKLYSLLPSLLVHS